jgi:hypothetical protein
MAVLQYARGTSMPMELNSKPPLFGQSLYYHLYSLESFYILTGAVDLHAHECPSIYSTKPGERMGKGWGKDGEKNKRKIARLACRNSSSFCIVLERGPRGQ